MAQPSSMRGLWSAAATLVALLSALATVRGQACSSTIYTTQPGDSLCGITNKYNVTSDAILTANPGALANGSRDSLLSSFNLKVPCPQLPCYPQWTYAAHAGESYFSISQKFGVNFTDLRIANKINISDSNCCNITCGDSITVPSNKSALPCALPPPPPSIVSTALPPPPPATTTPPPFTPLLFQFWIPTMTANQVSSPQTDSDYVNVFCKENGQDSSSSPQGSDKLDMHSGQTRHRWNGCQVKACQPNSIITMGFSVFNSGASAIVSNVVRDVTNLTTNVLNASGNSVWDPVAQSVGNIAADFTGSCEGLVAADGVYFMASNFTAFNNFQNGGFSRTYTSKHCSQDSRYSMEFLVVLMNTTSC